MSAIALSTVIDQTFAPTVQTFTLPGPGAKAYGPAIDRPALRRAGFFVPEPQRQVPVYVLTVPALTADQLPDGESIAFAVANFHDQDPTPFSAPDGGGNFAALTGSNGAGSPASSFALYWPGLDCEANARGDFDVVLSIASWFSNVAGVAVTVSVYRSKIPLRMPIIGPAGVWPILGIGIGVAVDVNS